MKKMYKRTTAIAATALMLAQLVPYNVFAEPAGPTSTLRIHPYVLNETDYETARKSSYSPRGTEVDDGQAKSYASAVENTTITFDIVEVESDGSPITSGYTASGVRVVSGVPIGYYKITPTNNNTDNRFKNAESFYLHLPVVVDGAARTDVDIYPKLTSNNDNGDSTDPDALTDPSDPNSNDKHSIKLTKTLSDPDDVWGSNGVGEAVFDIFYKDTLGNWVNVDENKHFVINDINNGILKVDGLPLGTYYAVEIDAPDGYLLDQTPIKFFLDGTNTNSVQTHEFVNDKELEVAKEVITSGTGTGLQYKWKITADVPQKTKNLLSYTITDKYTNLDITDIAIDGFTQGTHYTVEEDNVAGTVTIDFTKEGIAKLSGSSIEIKVTSNKAGSGASVANSAAIAYKYAYNPDPDDTIPDDIPGIIDPDDDDAYPEVKNYPVDPEHPDPKTKDEFTPATITISNRETGKTTELTGGKYDVSRCSVHKDDDYDGEVVTLANLAPGEYTIKQLATQSGYYVEENAAKNTKTIFIAKDGTVYEGTAAVAGKELTDNTVIFYNDPTVSGFDLPFTGTTATIVFTIAGIGVMGGALFFFIFFKKRDKDEEEKENA